MEDNKKQNNPRSYLKRKKGEIFLFDIYINKINQISIEKENGKTKLTIINDNRIIISHPGYIRKKRVDKYTQMEIDPNQCKFSLIRQLGNENKKVDEGTQTINKNQINNSNLLIKKYESDQNNKLNISEQSIIDEINNSNENFNDNNQFENLDINTNFINIVKTLNPINHNDIKIIKVNGDGN